MKWLRRLVVGWALFRLLAPEWVPSFGPGQQSPLRLPGRTVFVGDREIFVRETGPSDGHPLVLVHGWGDHSVVVFSKLIPLLAERYRVIAIDSRNNGKSDTVRGEYEIATMADEVSGVLDQLGIPRATVFGYSMGGMVAQALAQRYPHKVERMILSGTGAAGPATDPPVSVLAMVGATLARAGERVSRTEYSWLRTRYLLWVGAIEPEHALWYYTQHRNRDIDAFWEEGATFGRFDSREWVGRLDVPTLVIVMCDDQLWPPSFQYDLASRLKAPVVAEVPGARHEGPLTHPERMADAIDDFISNEVVSR